MWGICQLQARHLGRGNSVLSLASLGHMSALEPGVDSQLSHGLMLRAGWFSNQAEVLFPESVELKYALQQ